MSAPLPLASLPTPSAAAAGGEKWTTERVLAVRPWTESLWSFRISRPREFRFTPGNYGRVGLGPSPTETVWRPLSMVSEPADEGLEFLLVRVAGGTFSDLGAKLLPGDEVRLEKASYGFLTVGQLAPGRDLWLLASGSGLGPFVSILRDPAAWQRFEHLVLVHSVREPGELAYRDEIARRQATNHAGRLRYVPVVTRTAWAGALPARIPALIEDGRLEAAAGLALDPAHSRIMVCGNPDLVKDLRARFGAKGYRTCRRSVPGQIAFEKYW